MEKTKALSDYLTTIGHLSASKRHEITSQKRNSVWQQQVT